MTRTRSRATVLGAATVAAAMTGVLLATPAESAAGPAAPILTSWANPGVAKDGTRFVMLHTGNWNTKGLAASSSHPNGPWKRYTTRALLSGTPQWAKNPTPSAQKRSVWAPSLIKGGDGRWVVFYAALVHGRGTTRCIGTGTSDSAAGPYRPDKRPIACYKGSGTRPQDQVGNEHSTGLIDPTPAVVHGTTVLTYKTQHYISKARGWHTTIRMVQLNPMRPNLIAPNPVHAGGASVQLTTSVNRYIEENPSLVYRAGRYTLFTSWGYYGTRDQYWTRYRQNGNLWSGWASPHLLGFPSSSHTWGRGNAQVIAALGKGWNIFWNGQRAGSVRGEGPKYLYVGVVGWTKGVPRVTKMYQRR